MGREERRDGGASDAGRRRLKARTSWRRAARIANRDIGEVLSGFERLRFFSHTRKFLTRHVTFSMTFSAPNSPEY